MILVLYLLGDLLIRVSSTACYDGCFCYTTTMNCSKQSLRNVPVIPETVNNVDLSYNLIFEVEDENLIQNVEVLDLSHNRLRIFELDLSKSYLKTLKLSDNPLKALYINSTVLKFLDISWCDITHLQHGFLNMVPSLEVLDVSHNPLKVIHPLSGNLKQLYIQGCLFHKITFDLPVLDFLDVSFNRYMTVLKLESNLTTLKASHGSFYQAELALPKLKVLDISHNKLNQVYFNNPCLEILDISWNSLRSLDLVNVALINLDISHNLLDELQLSIEDLIFLNVSFNPLTVLKVFSASLKVVDCSSCKLQYIDLPPVHTLNLSRNGLESFTGEATHLDLSYNLLDSFKGKSKFVDLRGNRFSLPKKVEIAGNALLGNNPWLCKCEDKALKELYLKAVDKVICASPEGRSWDSCYTTKLPKYMKDYPWVPLVASGILTILVVICAYAMKRRLWADRSTPTQPSQDFEEIQPIRERVEDRLPSYEEALLMNKPRYANTNNRRSYEIVLDRQLSSSSI
uniref:Putative e3 ubiquitin-protein ligase ssph2 n=1 Tax=Panstrongylus lignarius TaxID=156445 RepID=A0A224XNG9_9HEMI